MPKGKAVSVSLSDAPETRDSYRSQQVAIVMEDGSVWERHRSGPTDWKWTEWECIYAPESA